MRLANHHQRAGVVKAPRSCGYTIGQSISRSHIPSAVATSDTAAYLGIDFGTSGARCCVIDSKKRTLAEAKTAYASSWPTELAAAWSAALFDLINSLPGNLRRNVSSVVIDGTSSTTLLIDAATGAVLQPPKLYNDAQDTRVVQWAKVRVFYTSLCWSCLGDKNNEKR